METLPGDNFKINVETMTRMAPMITPVMHNIKIDTHFFFVPNRLLWPEWEDWITGNTAVAPPTSTFIGTIEDTDLGNYLGYRTNDNLQQSVLPIAAYCLIYDEFYRAEHIQTSEKFIECVAGTGNATYNSSSYARGGLFHRAWAHDRYTGCLPSPQVGNAVDLPLLSQDDALVTLSGTDAAGIFLKSSDGTGADTAEDVTKDSLGRATSATDGTLYYDPQGTLEVNIAGDVTDINTLREAFALQRWLEKEMRAGTRYIEWTLAMFGQKSSDTRYHRPTYIGGASQNMVISEVLTTANSTGNPVGNMQGHGISAGAGKVFNFHAEEHGFIIGITSALPETGYYQGVDKMFTREDRYDYGNPMFAMLGEQPIYQKELYIETADTSSTYDTIFGYLPVFAHYKSQPNKVSGEFTSSLEYWHMDRKFTTDPALNGTFIECVHDKRNFASITGDNTIYALIANNIYAYRKLPKYGIPSIVG